MTATEGDIEKKVSPAVQPASSSDVAPPAYGESGPVEDIEAGTLKRHLKGRHMQMIAIGGAIGAGLFVSTGSALREGGPGALLLGYLIVGFMLLLTVQALGELAVLYPQNGAFFSYCVRFISPAWGFAVGWDYALNWLVILPFEITAAGMTIQFWRDDLNIGIWITVFLVVLSAIQIFGVRGYGEVEFVLGVIKVTALIGFIILGIVIDCGGAPKGGYIGAHYWYEPGAFTTFYGFCSVFTTAAFAFSGTEMTGLAAAEAANPAKSVPKACKQVFWRIMIFYIVGTLIVGLIVPHDADFLLGASGSNTKASPFVVSIQNAGISGLPSVMNAVITISVISVANSATYGSSRTIQALAGRGMAPKWMAYIDSKGRPIWCILLQILFGFLAFINETTDTGSVIFDWLLALSGISNFFVWGSICLAHIQFRKAWRHNGREVNELAYTAPFGVIGSWIGLGLNILCLIAEFYVSVYPKNAEDFFMNYLAAPIAILLFIFWQVYTYFNKDPALERGGWFIKVENMDVLSGMRDGILDVDLPPKVEYPTWGAWFKAAPMRIFRSLF
ncbi:Amino acid transporter [Penicillium longicatenatum]|uniref:Amino acid transporter n=1 Tax=Penicillium longicatenatum TaxID=1561947 RepID=UPI002549B35C|nr:Amino acid transporter [Penicillium longicatenatum]KAJ5658282.1 Amino acid transporter [Penicillium longicatenatum]